MTRSNRFLIFIFMLGLILFTGLVFSAWTIPHVVKPVANTLWLFLRVFVLSVDQVYYWNLLIVAIILWGIYRFARRKSFIQQENVTLKNETLDSLISWQESLQYAVQDGSGPDFAREKLLRLIIDYYAARRPGVDLGEIQRGLEFHLLPLPNSVYSFIFTSKSRTKKVLSFRAIRRSFSRWYRRMCGEEKKEFINMIDELIDFIKD